MRRIAWIITMALITAAGALAQGHRVDEIDPDEGTEFPGDRGRDEMIIYTPDYDEPTTGTNELGCEAIVRHGLVVSVGGNNSRIPADGYVLSGNGRAQSWIVRNLTPGMALAHDERGVWIDRTFDGEARSLEWRLLDLERRLAEFPASAEVASTLVEARDALAEVSDPLAEPRQSVANLETTVFGLELAAMESPSGEVHAVWHRLDTASREAIAAEAEAMARAGVNAVFSEVNFGSSGVYVDPTGLFPQIAKFEGTDPLAILIEECHARGIEVHAWVHNFFLGFPGSEYSRAGEFAEMHPEWVSVNRRGESELVPWGYMYLNPAHLELHDALIESHAALMQAYDLDGYHYDHIRYCLSLSWESGWDFSEYTRSRVREELGFDPLAITPEDEEWAAWIDWRQAQVTRYVERQTEAIRAVRPDALITGAVFPQLGEAIENKGQNWAAWVESGHLDVPMPMIYTPSVDDVRGAVAELVSHMPGGEPAVIGLGPYLGFRPELLAEQILAAREEGATGQCLFVWHRLGPENERALREGPWRWHGPPDWDVELPDAN